MAATPAKILAAAKTVVIDLDGVLFAGESPIDGAVDAVRALHVAGFTIGYLTNSSARSAVDNTRKLVGAGYPVSPRSVHTCFDEAVATMSGFEFENGAFVVGSPALRDALAFAGVTSASPEGCDCLLVGLDTAFDYSTLAGATTAAIRGVPFVACNRDPNYPGSNGRLLPGCGAIVAAIEAGSGRRADRVVGKPEPAFLNRLLERLGATSESTLVIGDTYDSDIVMARTAGASSLHIAPVERPNGGADATAASIFHFIRAAGLSG
jgi:HAD superfamily hydrolase (TIGR01450 family)